MNVFLLYEDREWVYTGHYYDPSGMIRDLGLQTLYNAAGKGVIYRKGQVSHIDHQDKAVSEAMRRVSMVPLTKKSEILYRQEIMRDCLNREGFVCQLYDIVDQMRDKWDKMGRTDNVGNASGSPASKLIDEIQVMKLFVATLKEIRKLMDENHKRLDSKGFQAFYARLCEECSDERMEALHQILEDVSFYTDVSDRERKQNTTTIAIPKIVVECGIREGLKLGDFELQEFGSRIKKYRNADGAIAKIQDYLGTLSSSALSIYKNASLKEQTEDLEYQAVRYVMNVCRPFMEAFQSFFDQLHVQIAFYKGAINLKHHILRYRLEYCFPEVGKREDLIFTELKEPVMTMEQHSETVGNSCHFDRELLLVVTGANQGGKSTFLRSIGVAQVMMQCGMFVCAKSYRSGLFPALFMHFTRREDSAMNSGRLDEELKRMSQIIDHVDDTTLILLNESFATTTEKEGSVIAYDIIKALVEANVKVLTVTHLLSFAQKVYGESAADPSMRIGFLSAERLADGKRTYKMIRHEPELTSFGLDLYEELVGEQ